jgi:hypothetical protein
VRTLGLLVLAVALTGCLPKGTPSDCATARSRALGWSQASPVQRSILAGDIETCGVLRKRTQSDVESILGTPSREESGRWIYLVDDNSVGQGWLRVAFRNDVVSDVTVKSSGLP